MNNFLDLHSYSYESNPSLTTGQAEATLRTDVVAAVALLPHSSLKAERFLLDTAKRQHPLPTDVLLMLAGLSRITIHNALLKRPDCNDQVRLRVAMSELEESASRNKPTNHPCFAQESLPLWIVRLAVDVQVELGRRGKDPWLANQLRERPELPLEARAALTIEPDNWKDDYFGWVGEDGSVILERVDGLRELFPDLAGLPMGMLVGVAGTVMPADATWQAAEVPAGFQVWAEKVLCWAKGEELSEGELLT